MSATEITVIVLGLVLGYWVVSHLIGKKIDRLDADDATGTTQSNPAPPAQPAPPALWHETLGIHPAASFDDVRAAYRSLMSQYHPDKVATLGPELRDLAERKTQEIGAAYREALRLHRLEE